MELSEEMIGWIDAHRNDDTSRLRLKYHDNPNFKKIDFMIMQIECRKRAGRKLPKMLQNPRFVFPTSLSAEQCTSETLAEVHAGMVVGDKVLDMTCGLGIDAFSIARKVASITAVEINPDVAEAARYNSESLWLDNVEVITGNCVDFLRDTDEVYDTIFIDPARRGAGGKRLFALAECEPNVVELLPELSRRCRRLIIKASPMLDVTQVVRELGNVNEIYVIGTVQECKEVVAVVDFDNLNGGLSLHAVTLGRDFGRNEMVYSVEEENAAEAIMGEPTIGGYLYEPYPSVMKAAPIKLLSRRYGVEKLHANTHLYMSCKALVDFPGERFRINDIIPFASNALKSIGKKYPTINVAVRNFIMTADELKRKLKVKDGGEKRLIGVTVSGNRRVILIVSRE